MPKASAEKNGQAGKSCGNMRQSPAIWRTRDEWSETDSKKEICAITL